MANTVLHNKYYIPHQSIILTNKKNLYDFSLEKVYAAYKQRYDCIGEDRAIWELEFHPTNCCNLRCHGCSYGTRHDGKSLTMGQITPVFERYAPYDLKSVFFSGGGDPLLWKHWDEFFSTVKKPYCYGIATNMYNFSAISDCWQKFDFFQIHVVGYNKDACRTETGVDSFKRIDDNITFLLGHKLPTQNIALKVLIGKDNFQYLPKFLDYLSCAEVDTIVIKFEQDFLVNRNLANAEILEKIRRMTYSHPIVSRFDYTIDNLDDIIYYTLPFPEKCLFANSGLYRLINASGEIFPCIASNANPKRKININSVFLDVYSKDMLDGKCPIMACRHFRFSQYLSQLTKFGCEMNSEQRLPLLL